jgi:ribonuclease HI
MTYTLRFDGIFWGVPGSSDPANTAGFMGYGWLIFRGQTLVAKGHGVFARGKDANSSIAEYLALIEGLEALLDMGVSEERVGIFGDAKGIIDQMIGRSSVNSPRIRPLYRRAMKLASRFSHLRLRWMPRRHNREADQLTRRAMRQISYDLENYEAAVKTIAPEKGNSRSNGRFLPLMDLRVFQPQL